MNNSKNNTYIHSLSHRLYKRDERAVFLYVQENSDDFQMFFPSEQCRLTFFRLVQELTANQKGTVMDLEAEISGPIQVKWGVGCAVTLSINTSCNHACLFFIIIKESWLRESLMLTPSLSLSLSLVSLYSMSMRWTTQRRG